MGLFKKLFKGVKKLVGGLTGSTQAKALKKQTRAIEAGQRQDAVEAAEAKTKAALGSNEALSADKRARQANVLALGAGSDDEVLGGSSNVLGRGAASAGASALGDGTPPVSAVSTSGSGRLRRRAGRASDFTPI